MTRLLQYFRSTSKSLLAEFEKSKAIEHRGEKGSAREAFIRLFIKSSFPSKFIVGSGEIIDAAGSVSPQSDAIIYDESMPVLSYGQVSQYLSEGVLAHIEIKSMLDKGEVERALANCAAVGALTHNLQATMIMGELRKRISSFVFAYEGPSAETFKKNVTEFITAHPEAVLPEGIFVLSQGYAAFMHQGKLVFVTTGEDTLGVLFARLHTAMWKNWVGFPDVSGYLGDFKFSQF